MLLLLLIVVLMLRLLILMTMKHLVFRAIFREHLLLRKAIHRAAKVV